MNFNLNEKSFTLVELLAVIVILSIIMVLTGPKVVDLFSANKQKAYESQVQMLKKFTKQYVTEFSNDVVWVGDTANITVDDLIDSGYVKSDLTNPITGVAICGLSYITITKNGNTYTYSDTMYDMGEAPCD